MSPSPHALRKDNDSGSCLTHHKTGLPDSKIEGMFLRSQHAVIPNQPLIPPMQLHIQNSQYFCAKRFHLATLFRDHHHSHQLRRQPINPADLHTRHVSSPHGCLPTDF